MVEDVVRNSGVKIDSLNKHPEDWRLKYIYIKKIGVVIDSYKVSIHISPGNSTSG